MKSMTMINIKKEIKMTLDEAWTEISKACTTEDAKYALMLIRADVGEKNYKIQRIHKVLISNWNEK